MDLRRLIDVGAGWRENWRRLLDGPPVRVVGPGVGREPDPWAGAVETAGRHGDWVGTWSGRAFWPLDPRPEELSIEDIAHHLSLQCRWAGATSEFYSVAEHSVRVARLLPPGLRLAGLLHDAAEAYLLDLPRPLKRAPELRAYADAEERLQRAVARRWGLPHPLPAAVKEADDILLATELRDLLPRRCWGEAFIAEKALPERIVPWAADVAERRFLRAFLDYGGTP